ncbi:hypothetical protein [Actinomadura sp. CNU-125]|uniref:hypothetical protein n=1 Tax=Actinomadura sp. CNU-125 TaxID=1904961 RepID=UPI001177DDF7|nr:hypothetical protein [Actinomadura sp. CNU-125]
MTAAVLLRRPAAGDGEEAGPGALPASAGRDEADAADAAAARWGTPLALLTGPGSRSGRCSSSTPTATTPTSCPAPWRRPKRAASPQKT